MPQVDIETLVSACAGDRKIACETLSDEDEKDNSLPNNIAHGGDQKDITELAQDFPPESFWLSKDAELDWMNHNAFFERKESTKGPTGNSQHQQHPSGSNSNSQRFGIKAAIIGLPKTQKASYVDARRRNANKPASTRLFPKKTGIVGKSVSSLTEPSSPKVSCMGRVRSKRRGRRSSESRVGKENPFERSRSSREKKKTGFCSGLIKIFKGNRKPTSAPVQEEETEIKVKEKLKVEDVSRKSLSGSRAPEFSVSTEPGIEPPGLSGMKRFSSGRRSTDEFDGVVDGSFYLDRSVGPTWSG